MQIQSQSSAKVTMPKNGRVMVDEDQYEDSMTDLDDFDLAKMFKPDINMDLTPVAAPEMVELINGILAKGNAFRSLNDKYIETYVTKGNDELYELLGAIYGFMLTINESPFREHILKRMREWLSQERSVQLLDTTPIETITVRYIVPTDRQTAFNYARVMKVAFIEKVAAKDLAGYIKGRGGITKIQDTIANEEAAKEAKTTAKKKLSLFKKILLANAKTITDTVEIPKERKLNLARGAKNESLFEFALVDNYKGDDYRIHQVISVPEAVGEQWLNYISQTVINDDVDLVQDHLDKLRAKLGITGGYGMEPGDKGYMPPGNIAQQAEKEIQTETAE